MICGCGACLYDCCRRISVGIDAVVVVAVVLAGSRAVDSAGVIVRDAAEVVCVCCGVVAGCLPVGTAGVVIRGAVEAVCCCAVVDGNRTVDIAGVGVRTGRLCASRLAFLGMGTSATQGNWAS